MIVGVSRILNEAALIEPFIRHHATLLDLHIVLDNGSTDRTLPILRALAGEGLALQVFQSVSPIFAEATYNTGLYRLALAAGADWAIFLDADELLDVRRAPSLTEALVWVPVETVCIQLPVHDYVATDNDTPAELNPFRRLTMREAAPHMTKMIVRRAAPGRIEVLMGQHSATVDGIETRGEPQELVRLGHFPSRSPLQAARKAILARMKAVASGRSVADVANAHHVETIEALKTDAASWLRDQELAALRPGRNLVFDPAPYAGGDLLFSEPSDDLASLLGQFAAQGELLARSHGRILDSKRLIRAGLEGEAAVARRLF